MVARLREIWVGGSTRQIQSTSSLPQDSSVNRRPHLGVETQQTLGTEQDRRIPAELQGSGDHACQPQDHPSDPRRGWIEQPHLRA